MKLENDLLANRYGRNGAKPKRNRILVILTASVLLVSFLAWAVWVSTASVQTVKSQDLAFEILSDQQASVRFSATLPPNQNGSAICAVQVLNQGFAVVGYREIELNQSGIYQTFVNTTEIGVSGHIEKCWLK